MNQILIALATSHKAHQVYISQHIAKCDARRLYETGEGNLSGAIEEAVVLEILSKRSIPQLKLTFLCYRHIYGQDYSKVRACSDWKSLATLRLVHAEETVRTKLRNFFLFCHIMQSLKRESSTEFEDAFRTVVKCISNPPKYYAKVVTAISHGKLSKSVSEIRNSTS